MTHFSRVKTPLYPNSYLVYQFLLTFTMKMLKEHELRYVESSAIVSHYLHFCIEVIQFHVVCSSIDTIADKDSIPHIFLTQQIFGGKRNDSNTLFLIFSSVFAGIVIDKHRAMSLAMVYF